MAVQNAVLGPTREEFAAMSGEDLIARYRRGLESFDPRIFELSDEQMDAAFLPDADDSTSLLNDASKANALFGNPSVTPTEMIEWIAEWIKQGGVMLNKPTHFQRRDGKF